LLAAAHAGSDVTFNLSHSGGIAMLAFTRRREIGIDVEQVRRDFDVEAIANRFFSAAEHAQLAELPAANRFEAFFRCWTRKEAYIKATGEGLSLLCINSTSPSRREKIMPCWLPGPTVPKLRCGRCETYRLFRLCCGSLRARHDWHLKG